MSFQVVPRTEIGLSEQVLNSKGKPRPALANARYLTVHYTGVNVRYGDVGDTPAEIRAIERWAAGQAKPNEYNYVIGQDPDDLIYEYAGAYRAAHSAGENDEAVGVLILNGIREPITDLQIDKLRWLRDGVLVPFGVLRTQFEQLPHQRMPGAATACPGDLIMSRWPQLMAPWVEPVAPTVLWTRVRHGDGYWSIARRVYGDSNVAENASALQAANGDSSVLRPNDLIPVPGLAVR